MTDLLNVSDPSPTESPFRPPRWLSGPHAQTMAGKLLRRSPQPHLRRERWTTPDGDFLDLDWGADPLPSSPVVLILHGLEGSSSRSYVQIALSHLHSAGVLGIAMNFRSCSGEPNRSARSYHSGETTDVRWVADRVRERFPSRPLGALGFSLGGNVLLKLLGESEDGGRSLLDAAAAVSVPFDLALGAARLEVGLPGLIYTHYFMRSLKKKVAARSGPIGLAMSGAALAATTIREFDDVLTAPLHGFVDAADYYRRSSSAQFVENIRVPTCVVHAMDDPFLPATAVPVAEMRANPWIVPVLSAHGGHQGFVSPASAERRDRFWVERFVCGWLTEALVAPL